MSRLKRSRSNNAYSDDLDMVPIMNMFLVLIPFLLMSASFYHIKAVNSSVPVLSNASNSDASRPEDKLIVIIELASEKIQLSAISDTVAQEILKELDRALIKKDADQYPLEELSFYLMDIKNRYPASDTILLIPDDDVEYDSIIHTMDIARKSNEQTLFPNVVLSGSLG